MNARLTPHIGSTLAQRAILRYRMEQRELDAERALIAASTAPAEVEALLDRCQPEPCQFCAPDDETDDARRDLLTAIAIAVIATPLVAAFANWVLPIVWSWK